MGSSNKSDDKKTEIGDEGRIVTGGLMEKTDVGVEIKRDKRKATDMETENTRDKGKGRARSL